MAAVSTARIPLPAWGAVEEIALTAEGVSVTVAATAMEASASGGTGPCIETHHFATICNDTSTARGGPWTPIATPGTELNQLVTRRQPR